MLILSALLVPGGAFAQTGGARTPPRANPAPTVRGFGTAGLSIFTAGRSFEAIFGASVGPMFGGGLEVDLQRHLFVSFGVSRFARTGHRVFVFEDQVFDLNQPTTVRITPMELSVGYRHVSSPRLRPYVGGGIGWHRYAERSSGATEADDAHETFTGYHVLAGAETPLRPWMALAGEMQFTTVPHALGQDTTSVASLYDEHDMGGLAVRAKLVIGR